MQYEIGQKVRIKDFKDMVRQYGVDEKGNINMGSTIFLRDMKVYCGEEYTIANKFTDDSETLYELEEENCGLWYFTEKMFDDKSEANELILMKSKVATLEKENKALKEEIIELKNRPILQDTEIKPKRPYTRRK